MTGLASARRDDATEIPRIVLDQACGLLIDVQDYFLAHLNAGQRKDVEDSTARFLRLCGWLRLPTLATVERPVRAKGAVPAALAATMPGLPIFEKEFFDLTKHDEILAAVRSMGGVK